MQGRQEPLLVRFEDKFFKRGEEECWEWFGSLGTTGYGQIKSGKIMEKAHRVSWKLYVGEIPDEMNVLHRCDNPKCVNPKHLFLGTHKDNSDDKWAKGREFKPPRKINPAITPELVNKVKATEGSQAKLSKEFKITGATVWAIKNNKHYLQREGKCNV